MKKQYRWFLALLILGTTVTVMADPGRTLPFTAATVAHRYHFFISGASSSHNNDLEMVGWFDATGSDQAKGVISAGRAEISMAGASKQLGSASLPLSKAFVSLIQLFEDANGIYSVSLRFEQDRVSCVMSFKLLLEDKKGESGKLAGTYNCEITPAVSGGGVIHGQVTAVP